MFSLIFLRHMEHCAHMKMIHDLISLSKILCFCVCLVSSCKWSHYREAALESYTIGSQPGGRDPKGD